MLRTAEAAPASSKAARSLTHNLAQGAADLGCRTLDAGGLNGGRWVSPALCWAASTRSKTRSKPMADRHKGLMPQVHMTKSSKGARWYERASDTSDAGLRRAPKGARTAYRGTQKTSKSRSGFKKVTGNFCRTINPWLSAAPRSRDSATLRFRRKSLDRVRCACHRGDQGRSNCTSIAIADAGNQFFRKTFDGAMPSPAVHNGACRG